MEFNDNELKLIFILKIGYNTKGEGLYEFIFSANETNIDIEGWCWDLSPACDNVIPPTEEFINAIFNLKTSTFDLYCLHESTERPYIHGFYTIHALAYEIELQSSENGGNDYEKMFENDDIDDVPLLVFHYGMSLKKIKEMLSLRKIVLRNNEFIESSSVRF